MKVLPKIITVSSLLILTSIALLSFATRFAASSSDLDPTLQVSSDNLAKILGPFFNIKTLSASQSNSAFWTCTGTSCSDKDQEKSIGVSAWHTLVLASLYAHINQSSGSGHEQLLKTIDGAINSRLEEIKALALNPDDISADVALSVSATHFRFVMDMLSEHTETQKLAQELTVLSALKVIFLADGGLALVFPLSDTGPGTTMMIPITVRNLIAASRWIREPWFHLTYNSIVKGNGSLAKSVQFLTRGKHDIESPDYDNFIDTLISDSFNYMTKSMDKGPGLLAQTASGIQYLARNSCWYGLALFEAASNDQLGGYWYDTDQIIAAALSDQSKIAFDQEQLYLTDVTPCIEFASLACRANNKYCKERRQLIDQWILPNIFAAKLSNDDQSNFGGLYSRSRQSQRIDNSDLIGLSTVAQAGFSVLYEPDQEG